MLDWGYFFRCLPEPFLTLFAILFWIINAALFVVVCIVSVPFAIVLIVGIGIRCVALHKNVDCKCFNWDD